jgi:hypothetical protein
MIIFGIWHDIISPLNAAKKAAAVRESEDDIWLEIEMLKEKVGIYFATLDGKEKFMGRMNPSILAAGTDISKRMTSIDWARRDIDASFKAGYFVDYTGIIYPVSQIKYVYFAPWQKDKL